MSTQEYEYRKIGIAKKECEGKGKFFFTLMLEDSRACYSDDAMVKRQPESPLDGIFLSSK